MSNKEGIVDDAAAAERGEKEIEEKSKETAAVVAATSIAAEKPIPEFLVFETAKEFHEARVTFNVVVRSGHHV